jgi:hypothetical protein
MLEKQLENHNKRALAKRFTNLELQFLQFNIVFQVL